MLNMFLDEMEAEAITRIQKFAKIASLMGYEIGVGFSGGKDSLVVYDLCKRAGIDCKFYFNHALEDLSEDKVLYVCRWLNHSFMPFTKKQEKLYRKFREYYDKIHHR